MAEFNSLQQSLSRVRTPADDEEETVNAMFRIRTDPGVASVSLSTEVDPVKQACQNSNMGYLDYEYEDEDYAIAKSRLARLRDTVEASSESADAWFRAKEELISMNQSQLKGVARKLKIVEDEIKMCDDANDSKGALIKLIQNRKLRKDTLPKWLTESFQPQRDADLRTIADSPDDDGSDEEKELLPESKLLCAMALRDIILYDRIPKIEDDTLDDLLATRSSVQWTDIIEASIKEVAAESQGGAEESKNLERICFRGEFGGGAGLGTAMRARLRLMMGLVTLWETLQVLGPDWSSISQAIQKLAQDRLFEMAAATVFGGVHSTRGRFGLNGLLRAGACLLRTDARGRVAAHLAAEKEPDLLIPLLHGAPLALLVEDSEGTTPLDILSESSLLESGGAGLDAVAGAALHCLAALPQQVTRVLRRNPSASNTWDVLAKHPGGRGLLLAAWEEDVEEKVAELQKYEEEREAGAVERLESGMQRVLLLRSINADRDKEIEALEREELQLRLKLAEDKLRQQDEAERQMKANLEREVKRLQGQLVEYEDELTSLRNIVASQPSKERERGVAEGPKGILVDDFPSLTSSISPSSKYKGRTAKQNAKAALPKTVQRKPSSVALTEVEVLEEIRNDRMVGTDLEQVPAELRSCIAGMRESLTAAVDRLAHDLYESEAHFIQELLQNADDNKYDPSVVPSLQLVLRRRGEVDRGAGASSSSSSDSYFYAANNEIGLSEADVRSICDISRSSKSQSDSSTTGHKGVGWKSVFRVCDSPHVLSKGWRFRFSTAGLGMLTPALIDDDEYSKLPAEVRQAHSSGLTVFYLPLTSDKVAQSIELEMEVVESEAAQLLFLRRIREITLRGFQGRSSELSVVDEDGIRTTTRCIRTLLDNSVSSVSKDASCDAEECMETHFEVCKHEDVIVALPLVQEPPPQRVFAFLPVRSAGFHFAVHAPFHLTASRADFHRSAENVRRRNAVAPAFLKACDASEAVACKALRFLGTVPAEPFWLSAHAAILAGLQGVACVMTESGMVNPQKCLLRGDHQVAQWVPEELLAESCGLAFASVGNPLAVMRDLGVQTFGFDHLVNCIEHNEGEWLKNMVRDPKASAFFSDIYAALHDGLVANVDRIDVVRKLCIFPTNSKNSLSAFMLNQVILSDSVGLFSGYSDILPRTLQIPLVRCMGDIEILAHGRKLLQVLKVERVDEATLEKIALRQLTRTGSPPASRSAQDAHTAWAALAVLQRCHKLGRTPPKPWTELQDTIFLPSANGEMLAPRLLQPWSFMGVEERLPRNVLQTVHEFAGIQLLSVSGQRILRERVAAPSWDRPSGNGIRWHLEWEIFLRELGCSPVDPAGSSGNCSVESTLRLGGVLTSGEFWRTAAQSPSMLNYMQSALGRGQTRRQWLRRLPVTLEDGSICSVEDFYLHESFHSLGGAHLPYVVGAPEEVHGFLSRLGVSTAPNQLALMKCLRWLRAHEASDTGLMADLYARLGELSITSLNQEPLPLIFVPGRGWVRPTDCCWNAYGNDVLQRCSNFSSLAEHYGRFGDATCKALQAWVLGSPENNVNDLVSALMNAINLAKGNLNAYTGSLHTLSQNEASSRLFEVAHYAITAIAKICAKENEVFEAARADIGSRTWAAPSDIARSHFTNSRLIVVPDRASPRVLWLHEAFWSIASELQQQPCATYALELHYGGNDLLRNFFVDVLNCKPVLTTEDMMQLYRQQGGNQSQQAGGQVIEGLSLFAFPSSSASSSLPTGPPPGTLDRSTRTNDGGVAAAMHMAQNAQHGRLESFPQRRSSLGPVPLKPPQLWRYLSDYNGFPVYVLGNSTIPENIRNCMPDTVMLSRIAGVFRLAPNQIGLAYDPTGHCVCEENLYLDISHGLRVARLGTNVATGPLSAATYWAAELARAIAHLSTRHMTSSFTRQLLQSEILATYLPLVMNSELAAAQAQAAYWRT